MNGGKTVKPEPATGQRLRGMTDEEVHAAVLADPEIKPTDEAFWKAAHVVMPQSKRTVTMRLDADLLAWFRRQRGYQTRIKCARRGSIGKGHSPLLLTDSLRQGNNLNDYFQPRYREHMRPR
jgi:uncharacterized protein (DUF4415 family)